MAVTRRTTASGWSLRWDKAQVDAAYRDGWWRKDNCGDALQQAARETPDRILIIDGDIRVSAAQLAKQADALARILSSRYPQGSAISFMLPNWHEAAIIYLAVTLAGMVANPILPSLREHDLQFILEDVGCRMIFIPGNFRGHDYAAMLDRVTAALVDPPAVAVVRGDPRAANSFDMLLQSRVVAELGPVDTDDVRMVMYTSGTTGRPKGVLHTHNSINALIRQIGTHWLVARGDRFLVPSPISHIGGSIYAFEMPLLLGTTAVLMESWSAEAAIPIMREEHITHMAGATPFLQQLLGAARAGKTRLPDLKLFICGGASVPPDLIREAASYFEKALVSRVYGSTEVPVTTVGSLGEDERWAAAETDGRPGIADIILGPGDEICARGPQMMLGYIHPEDEEGAFDERGFYRTGDQGRFEGDGHLVVTGRIKDLIIRNGENVAPKEIEDLLVSHPAIADIAIVGIPDAKTGERAVAVIVPRGNETPDVEMLAVALSALGVAKFKYPEQVELWDALPKNDAGKVLKAVIRQRLVSG